MGGEATQAEGKSLFVFYFIFSNWRTSTLKPLDLYPASSVMLARLISSEIQAWNQTRDSAARNEYRSKQTLIIKATHLEKHT